MMKKSIGFMLMAMISGMLFFACDKQKNSVDVDIGGGTVDKAIAEQTATVIQEEDGITKISTEDKLLVNGGKFQGWGTGIAWWGNRLGYSDALTEQAVKLFFDEDTGLGMNIVRYNIPGGDDPTHTHITRTDTKLAGFTYYDEESGTYEFDRTADANQRNVLLKIKEFCGDRLTAEAYACSPPYYMTESGCTSGSYRGINNNLKEEYYDDYAAYIADVLEFYRDDYGILFDSVSIMNEPTSNRWIELKTQQEGCYFDPNLTIDLMYTTFDKVLKERGLGSFDISIDNERKFTGRLYGVYEIVTKINVHTDNVLSKSYDENALFVRSCALVGEDNLWITQCDSNLKHDKCIGEMSPALWFAKKIISDMGGFMPAAWMIENAIDYHISAGGYQGNQDTGMPDTTQGYWGLAVADHDNEKIILTKKYYAYGQFSRYIRPGYTIFADNNDDVLVSYSPDEKKLVIVAVNNAGTETELKVSLEGFDYAGGTARVIRTSGELEGGENWAELPDIEVDKDVFGVNLKGYSITTFIIDDVTLK